MLFAGMLHPPGQLNCAAIRPDVCTFQFTMIAAVRELSPATGGRLDGRALANAVRG